MPFEIGPRPARSQDGQTNDTDRRAIPTSFGQGLRRLHGREGSPMKHFVLTLAFLPNKWGDGPHVGAGMPMAASIQILTGMPMAVTPGNHDTQGTTCNRPEWGDSGSSSCGTWLDILTGMPLAATPGNHDTQGTTCNRPEWGDLGSSSCGVWLGGRKTQVPSGPPGHHQVSLKCDLQDQCLGSCPLQLPTGTPNT